MSTSASRSMSGPMPPAPSRKRSVAAMWLPVAVAMPMPTKLPITSANTESFWAAKMPVAPGLRPTRRNSGPRSSRPMTSSSRMPAMNPKAATATQHSPRCQSSTSRRTCRRHLGAGPPGRQSLRQPRLQQGPAALHRLLQPCQTPGARPQLLQPGRSVCRMFARAVLQALPALAAASARSAEAMTRRAPAYAPVSPSCASPGSGATLSP